MALLIFNTTTKPVKYQLKNHIVLTLEYLFTAKKMLENGANKFSMAGLEFAPTTTLSEIDCYMNSHKHPLSGKLTFKNSFPISHSNLSIFYPIFSNFKIGEKY